MPARAQRKPQGAAVMSGKIKDNMACLRGAATGGAEIEKNLELPDQGLYGLLQGASMAGVREGWMDDA